MGDSRATIIEVVLKLFVTIERAARLDAGLLVALDSEPRETETRAVVVRTFFIRDPERDIDAAIHAKDDCETANGEPQSRRRRTAVPTLQAR
jgi:hypothetical protein